MSLQFVQQDGAYNSNTQAVRFFAVDGNQSRMFTVSREALEDLEHDAPGHDMTEADILAAYEKHLARIRDVAERVYRTEHPDSAGAYRVRTEHFR